MGTSFTPLFDLLRNDPAIRQARKEYEELTGRSLPGFNLDEYKGPDDYRDRMVRLVQELKEKESQ